MGPGYYSPKTASTSTTSTTQKKTDLFFLSVVFVFATLAVLAERSPGTNLGALPWSCFKRLCFNVVSAFQVKSCASRAKLLQFEENERPAYWGTWSKKSTRVGPRRPFAQDCEHLNYEYDSDEDWEEEQDGEDLASDDDQVWLPTQFFSVIPFCKKSLIYLGGK